MFNAFFDDTPLKDEWQNEVYEKAHEWAVANSARSVLDIGCGSGFKLLKYFHEFDTIGTDLEPTLTWLRKTHPDRCWELSARCPSASRGIDVAICADVIEHVRNPDVFMNSISELNFEILFLSTPDRCTVYGHDHDGPPRNRAHCREWTLAEFKCYVEKWFTVQKSYISNTKQGTQLVVCTKRSKSKLHPRIF